MYSAKRNAVFLQSCITDLAALFSSLRLQSRSEFIWFGIGSRVATVLSHRIWRGTAPHLTSRHGACAAFAAFTLEFSIRTAAVRATHRAVPCRIRGVKELSALQRSRPTCGLCRSVHGTSIDSADVVCDLRGLTRRPTDDMKHPISASTATVCFYHLRDCGSSETRSGRRPRVLATSLVLSRIDRCNIVVVAGLPASILALLQRLQNAATRCNRVSISSRFRNNVP